MATGSFFASRSEAFQLEQEQRGRIETVRTEINVLLEAVDQRDDDALGKAINRLDINTLYLPQYKRLLIPLNMAYLGKQSDLNHYRIQSYDVEKEIDNADESILTELDAEGWRKISWEALRVESKLRLSQNPFTLECDTELCDQLAL